MMTRVKCSVENCSYNESGGCYASAIDVGGAGAMSNQHTCCATFLNRAAYSNLTELPAPLHETDAVACQVETCRYHDNQWCTLNEIEVGSQAQASLYTQTDCNSFEVK